MGQYYYVVLGRNGVETSYDRSVDGEYTMAKLTEHSWWGNSFVSSINKLLYKTPTRVAWIGDYSDSYFGKWFNGKDPSIIKHLYELVWADGAEKNLMTIKEDMLELDDKYLVNHTQKLYLDCNKYKKSCEIEDGWVLAPLPLLTAIGNGQGGGDYYGPNKCNIGDWYWDLISVEDEIPDNYNEVEYFFKE
jgi:hypothetical protein